MTLVKVLEGAVARDALSLKPNTIEEPAARASGEGVAYVGRSFNALPLTATPASPGLTAF